MRERLALIVAAACAGLLVARGCEDGAPIIGPQKIPGAELTVLIVEETDQPKLRNVIGATRWRQYVQSEGGKYLVLDVDDDASLLSPAFATARAQHTGQTPELIVGDGVSRWPFIGPVPESEELLTAKIGEHVQ